MVRLTILGEPASKANRRKLVHIRGKTAVIKSDKARAYEASALMQIPASARLMLTCPVRVTMTIFYRTERPDLDESVILDVLQARYISGLLVRKGVYVNDRQVREKRIHHAIDRANPRAEIEIEPLAA
jgi:Holliday junction resolvase RusA-like endonuclease